MAKPKERDGCAIFMRRTFLFFVGLGIAKLLKEYFAIADNRATAWSFLQRATEILKRKYVAWRTGEPEVVIPPSPQQDPPVSSQPNNSLEPDKEVEQIEDVPETIVEEEPPATPDLAKNAEPIKFEKKTLFGVSFYQTTIDLNDPETFITIGLANDAPQANSNKVSYGDEPFTDMVNRFKPAVAINGTFFSIDDEKRVLGNMVAGGKILKYSQWENYGTTLGIKAGNELEMVTARYSGQPDWSQHWFSVSCGPRLIKDGKVWLKPELEGFKDPHVFDTGGRTAIGYSEAGDKIYLVTFLSILSLKDEAKLMQGIGCYQAMNLDGGASRSLAYRDRIIVPAGRPLTNIIMVYDVQNPAPAELKESWHNFQQQPKGV